MELTTNPVLIIVTYYMYLSGRGGYYLEVVTTWPLQPSFIQQCVETCRLNFVPAALDFCNLNS